MMRSTGRILKYCLPILGAIFLLSDYSSAASFDPKVQRGASFALSHCSKCHAIGKVGDSPLAEAPPFRTLHELYPVEDLAESFAEGIKTGHPTMPEWRLDPDQIENLIAYLKSL